MNDDTIKNAGVAIVTGATGGIGSATARQLAEAGWTDLLLCDVDPARLEAMAIPLRERGATVTVLAGDIADPAFPGLLLQRLDERPLGALVHTAGLSPRMAPPERILDVNLDATVRLVNAVREHMAEGTAAVLIASNSSYFPLPPDAMAAFEQPLPPGGTASLRHFAPTPELAYPLSKLGVRALVKQQAKAFGQRGARIVSISPGAIDTPMVRLEMEQSDGVARMIERAAIARLGKAEEIAAVAAFLCSPAASLVTACDMLVDGGQTAGLGF